MKQGRSCAHNNSLRAQLTHSGHMADVFTTTVSGLSWHTTDTWQMCLQQQSPVSVDTQRTHGWCAYSNRRCAHNNSLRSQLTHNRHMADVLTTTEVVHTQQVSGLSWHTTDTWLMCLQQQKLCTHNNSLRSQLTHDGHTSGVHKHFQFLQQLLFLQQEDTGLSPCTFLQWTVVIGKKKQSRHVLLWCAQGRVTHFPFSALSTTPHRQMTRRSTAFNFSSNRKIHAS